MKSDYYRHYFKDKRVTQMGLGLLGRGIGDAKFLVNQGVDLVVTDMKSVKELAVALKQIPESKKLKYVLGQHRLIDFKKRDFILKAAGVPLDSPYIAEARRNKIPIEMDASLFCKIAMPLGVKVIGVTGTRGKTTVTYLIYEILKAAGYRIFLGGNIRGVATLPLLEKVEVGDWVVLELDSWQLQGFGPTSDQGISPNVAVFTNLMTDHLNYYQAKPGQYFLDKANIFKYQTKQDSLILGQQIAPRIKRQKPKGQVVVVGDQSLPVNWKLKLLGDHNRFNAALALGAARAVGVPDRWSKKAIINFAGVPGRLELVGRVRGISFYNDTTATTPEAVVAALKALSSKVQTTNHKKIILIAGGADKNLPLEGLIRELPKYVKQLILLPGTGTNRLKAKISERQTIIQSREVASLAVAVLEAVGQAGVGDLVLLSPGFASFGPPPGGFKNEYDRGDQFVELVKRLN